MLKKQIDTQAIIQVPTIPFPSFLIESIFDY